MLKFELFHYACRNVSLESDSRRAVQHWLPTCLISVFRPRSKMVWRRNDGAEERLHDMQRRFATIHQRQDRARRWLALRWRVCSGLSTTKSFIIAVANAADAPTGINLSPTAIDENSPAGTAIGTLATVDEDSGDTFTYQLVAGNGVNDADNGLVVVDAATCKLVRNKSQLEGRCRWMAVRKRMEKPS